MKFTDLTKPELVKILNNANFTKEEEQVFLLSAKGKSIVEIAYECAICERTVTRRRAKIKTKISKIGGLE